MGLDIALVPPAYRLWLSTMPIVPDMPRWLLHRQLTRCWLVAAPLQAFSRRSSRTSSSLTVWRWRVSLCSLLTVWIHMEEEGTAAHSARVIQYTCRS